MYFLFVSDTDLALVIGANDTVNSAAQKIPILLSLACQYWNSGKQKKVLKTNDRVQYTVSYDTLISHEKSANMEINKRCFF